MKNKKGFLLGEHTVDIVIAVLAITILVGLGVKLYGIFIDAKGDMAQAEGHMIEIMSIINELEKQGSGEKYYVLLSPETWLLTGWPFTPLLGEEEVLPKTCDNDWNNCLCFCDFNLRDQILQGRSIGHEGVLDACESSKAICKEIRQKELIVNGKELLGLSIFPEQSIPISVNELLEEGKGIVISLDNDKLRIDLK